MYKKHFTVSFVILVTISIGLQLVRGQDCDPTSGCNDQSYCVSNGYCSCLSGFSGDSCTVPPQSSCSSSYKDPTGSQFSFDPQLEFSLTLNLLNIQINASLENNRYEDSSASPPEEDSHDDSIYSLGTTITWSGESACDYPSSPYWTKAAVADGFCLDSYALRMDIDDALSTCGFTYNPSTNEWWNDVTVTRYYSQPPDMTIVDPSRRAEGRRMISVESKTTTITLPSNEKPKPSTPASDSNQDVSSTTSPEVQEEISPSPVTSKGSSYDRELFIKIAAAVAGAVGLAFIAALIVVIAVRRRRSRNAQAQFNFEGIDSN